MRELFEREFHLTDYCRAEKTRDVVPLDAILVPLVQKIKFLPNVDYFLQNVEQKVIFSIDVGTFDNFGQKYQRPICN